MNRKSARPFDLSTLLHAAHAAEAEVEARLAGIGLSMAKLQALKALTAAGESMPLSQLAERLACVKSNITQLVDRLEADGFVARQANPHDRRARLAVLTAPGRRACQEGVKLQDDAERALLGGLSATEAEQLTTLLAKVKPADR
jgi:DNA-binding MarR family transcriptional regulator